MQLKDFIGKAVDGLPLSDRWALSGHWIALELYSPQRLPLRLIQAVGVSPRECIQQLQERNLNPALYEFEALNQPYQP
jgi:hypothetical protein